MANASAKRIASQNETAIRNMRLGMLVSGLLSILLRVLFRRSSLRFSFGFLTLCSTYAITFFMYRFLENNGTPKRDSSGELKSSGEDLSQGGLTELCFDVLYITWACQIGSAAFGEWVWWLYLVIPLYAFYKLWTLVISPFVLGRSAAPGAAEAEAPVEASSKRQEKLRKRQERGDPRVQRVQAGKRS
ncbi:hypothetical protein JAAARDRAFT_52719 [Jaapia argillacea MUCL 33604]|uniref:DUF788-domain-containing protein n=1 Tax=Jaapia argillacea MUCL 33604 TaxID=933084 RepID=A0A067QQ58_9AGAM|nr:hypothetical protein JAAARDRAFT_52719 [Jaapia argillacea MUCL 33604]